MAESTTTGKREEAVGEVVDAIRGMIIGGELLPGQQIRQEHMAVSLGLSRIWDWAKPCQAVSRHESAGRQRVIHEHNAMVAALPKGCIDDVIELMDRSKKHPCAAHRDLADGSCTCGLAEPARFRAIHPILLLETCYSS